MFACGVGSGQSLLRLAGLPRRLVDCVCGIPTADAIDLREVWSITLGHARHAHLTPGIKKEPHMRLLFHRLCRMDQRARLLTLLPSFTM